MLSARYVGSWAGRPPSDYSSAGASSSTSGIKQYGLLGVVDCASLANGTRRPAPSTPESPWRLGCSAAMHSAGLVGRHLEARAAQLRASEVCEREQWFRAVGSFCMSRHRDTSGMVLLITHTGQGYHAYVLYLVGHDRQAPPPPTSAHDRPGWGP